MTQGAREAKAPRRFQARYRRSGASFSVQDRDLVAALDNIRNTRGAATYGSGQDFSESFAPAAEVDHVPTALGVYVKGLAHTIGFKDSLQNEPEVEVPVPEHPKALTLEGVCGAFAVEAIASRRMADVHQRATDLVEKHSLEENFCIVDLATVKALFDYHRVKLPRVRPHYAVKCLPDRGIISTLAALGAGFDCASQGEVELVTSLGVPSERIILAHPVKRPCDLRCIAEHDVPYTTFDSVSELHKILASKVKVKLVLRIRADDPMARLPLGAKYGAPLDKVPELLSVAALLNLDLAGVSFHVGSSSRNPDAYRNAISYARQIFDQAVSMGFHMHLLDLGGGFTGSFNPDGTVTEAPSNFDRVREALDEIFPDDGTFPGLQIIDEPGRYFAQAPVTMACLVYGKREGTNDAGERHMDYYITDGLYGSFNGIIYDGLDLPTYFLQPNKVAPLSHQDEFEKQKISSTVYGPTCDSLDCVMRNIPLPELSNGDWLMFPDAGAYTMAGACDFNGILCSKYHCFYVWSEKMTSTATKKELEDLVYQNDRPACTLVQNR
jgi:ornithine decarboxylase